MGGKRPEARLQAPPIIQDLAFCYSSAKDFYDPSKVAATIGAAAKKADRNVALAVFVLAGAITFFLAFLTSLESVYLVNYSSDLVSQMSGIPQPRLELESLVPVAVYQILLYMPASIIVALLNEAITFGIFRATGGKGKFWTQVFLASIIGLSISFSGVLSFFVPLPCLQIVAGIGIFALTLYFMFYVTGKAYMEIHGISALHAGVVILFLAIARLAALAVLTNALAVLMGLPTPINLPEGV